MNAEDLFSAILTSTYTTADFHRRLALLRHFFEEKFFSGSATYSLNEFFSGNEMSQSDVQFLRSLSEDFYSSFTKDNAYSLIDAIERAAKNTAKIILYVSFQIPPEEIAKIGTWFRQNLPTNVIIDLKTDLAAFGGCMFVWNGYLSDYSLRYLLAKHKQEIGTIITKYGANAKQ